MIELFVTNVGASVNAIIDYFVPIIQYMFINPIVGFGFMTFVIMGFVSILLHIKNIIKEGVTR